MSKAQLTKLRKIKYEGVREWVPVSLRLHPDLVEAIDQACCGQKISRNEFIFTMLRIAMMSQATGGDMLNNAFGEAFIDTMAEQAATYFGIDVETLKDKIRCDITKLNSDDK